MANIFQSAVPASVVEETAALQERFAPPAEPYQPQFTPAQYEQAASMQGQGPLVNLPSEQSGLMLPVEVGNPYVEGNQVRIDPAAIKVPTQAQPEFDGGSAVPAQAAVPQTNWMDQATGLTEQQKKINNALAEAGAAKASYDMGKQVEASRMYEKQIADEQEKAKNREVETQSQVGALNKAQQDFNTFLNSPDAKVKPNQFWEQASTGQKVLAGIALVLGAAGAAADGKNAAVDVLTKAIDRDIEAQKQNIQLASQGKLQNYNMQNNLYNQMLSKFKNQDMAEAAVRTLRLQQLQTELNAKASEFQGQQVKLNAQQANNVLDQGIMQQKMAFEAAARQQALLRQMGGSEEAMLSGLPAEIRERYVPGYGAAVNKQGAMEFQKVRAGSEPALSAIDRITPLLAQLNRVTDLGQKAKIETELKALAGALRLPITGPGALTDDEYKRLRDTIGNPQSLLAVPSIELKKLNQIRTKVANDLDSAALQYGLPTKNKNIRLKTLKPN